MANMNEKCLKLAVQKEGRLSEETSELLRKAGLDFESYKHKLFSSCRNFPLEIIFVRDDDIPDYVASGTVDIGIVGQNLLCEKGLKIKKLLDLHFGFCSLMVAVPKESKIKDLKDLSGKTVATSYPKSTKTFFKENGIKKTKIIHINGSVEIAPSLGIAEAIVDLTATGSTMALNDLRPLAKIYDSEAVLITNRSTMQDKTKLRCLNELITRFKGVLLAKDYKYIMMNVPQKSLSRVIKIIPGLKSPTVSPLATEGWVSVQTVIKEDAFWEIAEKLTDAGASGIIVLPFEKMIL